MVFHDLFHNGKAKPGALRLMRHIGFGQSFGRFFAGQANAIIRHLKGQHIAFLDDAGFNPPGLTAFAHGDGVCRILQKIGQRLTDQAAITGQFQPLRRCLVVVGDIGMRIALQHQRFQHQAIGVFR